MHSLAWLLITIAVGYWVLIVASKEKGGLKKLGKVLGIVIIVLSFLGVGCKLYYKCSGTGYFGKGMGFKCPISQRAAATPSVPTR